ncbi:MAG TPA: hypothetical protein VF587_10220 [Solirubrobacteraceae bacterium]
MNPRQERKRAIQADAERGHPDVDLADYADLRGLSHRGNATQLGYMAALGMSEDLQFNILRGRLPGGESGIVFHDMRVLKQDDSEDGQMFGLDYAKQIGGPKRGGMRWGRFITGIQIRDQFMWFRLPCTTAAIRVPEAAGLLAGLNAGREPERGALIQGQWQRYQGGPRSWMVGVRQQAEDAIVKDVVDGPLTQLLEQSQPPGFEVWYRFGLLWLSQIGFARTTEELDQLCEKTSWLAQEIRAICERHGRPLDFDVELPRPHWEEAVRANRSGQALGGDAQNLTGVVELADQLGMTMEDPFGFMRGFFYVPVPGELFGVLRGDDLRIAIGIERPAWDEEPLQKVLTHRKGGPFGCDTVMIAVPPATPETPGSEGETWIDGGRVSIKRGVLAAWRKRERVRPQRHEVEALIADARDVVRDRGLVC